MGGSSAAFAFWVASSGAFVAGSLPASLVNGFSLALGASRRWIRLFSSSFCEMTSCTMRLRASISSADALCWAQTGEAARAQITDAATRLLAGLTSVHSRMSSFSGRSPDGETERAEGAFPAGWRSSRVRPSASTMPNGTAARSRFFAGIGAAPRLSRATSASRGDKLARSSRSWSSPRRPRRLRPPAACPGSPWRTCRP